MAPGENNGTAANRNVSPAAPVSSGSAAGKRLGIGMHSYGAHWRAARQQHPLARFHDALTFLDYASQLGAGGVQVSLGTTNRRLLDQLRVRAEEAGVYLEAQTGVPTDDTPSEWDRFEAEVEAARAAGSRMLRTAMLGGRRYETFASAVEFEQFAENSWKRLMRAEPILRRHRIALAVENHKDWRVPELIGMLERLGSEWVGVTLDTGNSIALLEDPMEVVTALAPFALTTHLKDMAVAEVEDGFLLAEVPLGEGFLDLQQIVDVCLRSNPSIQFNLEMITRDPLRIPCLKEPYWATLGSLPARDLARSVALVRRHRPALPLPTFREQTFEALLAAEDDNVRRSLAFAGARLRLERPN